MHADCREHTRCAAHQHIQVERWDFMQSFLCPDGCLQLEVVPQPLGWEAVCRLSCLPSWAHVVHKKCEVSLQLIYQYI